MTELGGYGGEGVGGGGYTARLGVYDEGAERGEGEYTAGLGGYDSEGARARILVGRYKETGAA